MCLDAMALQYLEQASQPSQAKASFPVRPLREPDPDHEHDRQAQPQQLPHPFGEQTTANQQAPHVSPMHPTDVASYHAVQQQLQGMNIHSFCSQYQTPEQSSSDISQPVESAHHSSPPINAEPCVNVSHASKTHPETLEVTQAALDLYEGLPAEAQDQAATQLPHMTHTDLIQLQSHAVDFTDKDRRDWLINLRFLRASMQHAHWPGDVWSEDALLEMVGRIASNNFGVYSTRQRPQPRQPAASTESCGISPIPDQAVNHQPQCLLLPSFTTQHSSNVHWTCDQIHATPHNVVEKDALRQCLSPDAKASSASQPQPASSFQPPSQSQAPSQSAPPSQPHPKPASPAQADAHSGAVTREVLPWPLQAEVQSPLPPLSAHAVAAGSTLPCSSLTADRPGQQQPSQPDSPVLLADKVKQPSKVELPSNNALKHPAQRLLAKEKPAKEDVVGREIYITASFFNHSCEPNCIKHRLLGQQQSGVATVTALRDIKASMANYMLNSDQSTDYLFHADSINHLMLVEDGALPAFTPTNPLTTNCLCPSSQSIIHMCRTLSWKSCIVMS